MYSAQVCSSIVLKELKERQYYAKPSVERREKKKLRLRRIKANNDSF